MPSLFLSCAALLSPRLRRRRQAALERDQEYARDFDKLQSENEKRFKRLSQQQHCCCGREEPPVYDEARNDVEGESGSEESGSSGEEETGHMVARGLRPKESMVDRRDWAVMTRPTAAGA